MLYYVSIATLHHTSSVFRLTLLQLNTKKLLSIKRSILPNRVFWSVDILFITVIDTLGAAFNRRR